MVGIYLQGTIDLNALWKFSYQPSQQGSNVFVLHYVILYKILRFIHLFLLTRVMYVMVLQNYLCRVGCLSRMI